MSPRSMAIGRSVREPRAVPSRIKYRIGIRTPEDTNVVVEGEGTWRVGTYEQEKGQTLSPRVATGSYSQLRLPPRQIHLGPQLLQLPLTTTTLDSYI